MVRHAATPFFVTNFVVLVMVLQGLHFVGMVGLAAGIALMYFAMLATSISGFAAVVALRRDGRINRASTTLFTVMLAMFVSDVAAAIMMFQIERRTRSVAMQKPDDGLHQ